MSVQRRSPEAGPWKPERSIVVPAHNEAARLPVSLPGLLSLADGRTEVLFVDDGSTDSTHRVLANAVGRRRDVRVVRLPDNVGKGGAVRAGVSRTRGRTVAYMDADLATDLRSLGDLEAALKHHHVALGSRAVPGTVIEAASKRRSRMGGVFNRLVRTVTGIPFRDTQCGFKAFDGEVARLLFQLTTTGGFAFDVELISLSLAMGLDVTEVPVRWREVDGTHVRPLRDPARMAYDVVTNRFRRSGSVPTLLLSAGHRAEDVQVAVASVVGPGRLVIRAGELLVVPLPCTAAREVSALAAAVDAVVAGNRPRVQVLQADRSAMVELFSRRDALLRGEHLDDGAPSSIEDRTIR